MDGRYLVKKNSRIGNMLFGMPTYKIRPSDGKSYTVFGSCSHTCLSGKIQTWQKQKKVHDRFLGSNARFVATLTI